MRYPAIHLRNQMSEIKEVTVVKVYPTRIWIENGIGGERIVVVQHEGCDPFDYAVFGYDYRYTSNAGTWEAAHSLALSLGATEPVETRQRGLGAMPTADWLRERIGAMQETLARLLKLGQPSA
jgi:hypothetical protein